MSLLHYKKKYTGSSVDGDEDVLTNILEAVDPILVEEGKQLFQNFLIESIKGGDLVKPFLDGILALGVQTPFLSSNAVFMSVRLCRLVAKLLEPNETLEQQAASIQLTNGQDLAKALVQVARGSGSVEEKVVALLCISRHLMDSGPKDGGQSDPGAVGNRREKLLDKVVGPDVINQPDQKKSTDQTSIYPSLKLELD